MRLRKLPDLLGAPVTKALLGKAVLPDDSPFTTGRIGNLGTARTKTEPVRLTPCVLILRKLPDKSDGRNVLDSSTVWIRDPVPQHPGFSFLASYFL